MTNYSHISCNNLLNIFIKRIYRFGYDQQGVSVDITVEVETESSVEETTTGENTMVTEMGKRLTNTMHVRDLGHGAWVDNCVGL